MTLSSPVAVLGLDVSETRAEAIGRRGARLSRALIWLVALAPAITSFAYSRVVGDLGNSLATSSAVGRRLLFVDLVLIALVSVYAVAWAAPVVGLWRPTGLWLAFMAYAAALFAASRYGYSPFFDPRFVTVPLLVTAWWALPTPPLRDVISTVRHVVLGYAYGSFVAAVVVPSRAIERPYSAGFLPVGFRLHGIGSHANILAPVLAAYVALGFYPNRSRLRWLHRFAVLLALVLTQSKTTLVGVALIAALYLVLPRHGRASGGVTLLRLAVPLAVAYAIFRLPVGQGVAGQQQAQLESLTGRTELWRVSLGYWRTDRVFGYGPHMWDTAMRLGNGRALGWFPPHCHSQYVQALAETGVLGFAALLALILVLARYAWLGWRVSGGATLALFVLLFSRTFSEVPLQIKSVVDVNSTFALLVVPVLITAARQAIEQ